MAEKFDQYEKKHQLLHLFINLAMIFTSIFYLKYDKNWVHVGSFRQSLILPIVFFAGILKVILARYYNCQDDYNLTQKLRQKKRGLCSLKHLMVGTLVQLLSTILYAFVSIVLGAPVLYNYEQTFALAVLLTFLTVSPTVFLMGGGGALEVCLYEKLEYITKTEAIVLDLFKCNALSSLVGAWAGSIVVPLDWGCDWQFYPIPHMIGSLIGCAMYSILSCSHMLFLTGKTCYKRKRS